MVEWVELLCMWEIPVSHCGVGTTHNILRVQPTRCNVSQFISFCKALYMFQTGFPSIIRGSKLHIQSQVLVWQIPDAVCAVLSSWWWTESPSEICRASFFYELDAQILYLNTFITFLYMFRALLCSSSGGQIVLVQHLVSSLSIYQSLY